MGPSGHRALGPKGPCILQVTPALGLQGTLMGPAGCLHTKRLVLQGRVCQAIRAPRPLPTPPSQVMATSLSQGSQPTHSLPAPLWPRLPQSLHRFVQPPPWPRPEQPCQAPRKSRLTRGRGRLLKAKGENRPTNFYGTLK